MPLVTSPIPPSSFIPPLPPHTFSIAAAAILAADEKFAHDPLILDMRRLHNAFDALVVASGSTALHVRAITRAIIENVHQSSNRWPDHIEGNLTNEWVALDYSDVVVHILNDAARSYYDLEHLWNAAPASHLTRPSPAPPFAKPPFVKPPFAKH